MKWQAIAKCPKCKARMVKAFRPRLADGRGKAVCRNCGKVRKVDLGR